jgi:hypothetical protein
VGRVKVHGGEFGFGCVYTDGFNEAKGLVDFPDEETVTRSFFGSLHKVQIPSVQSRDVSKSTRAEGAQNVESLSALEIGLHHPVGVAIFGQWHPIDDLIGIVPRLGKLPGLLAV